MAGKIIAFQRMMFQIIFSQSFSAKQNTVQNKSKKTELIILLTFLALTYFTGIKLFSGLIGMMVVFLIAVPHIYRMLCVDESIILHLPLKRRFVTLNIFIFPILISLILILIMWCFFSLVVFLPNIITLAIKGNTSLFNITKLDIAMMQELMIIVLYFLAYVNGLIVSFFVKKSKLRISIIIVNSLIFSALPLYIYQVIPKDPKQSFFNLPHSLLLLPNSWTYVALEFLAVLAVTLSAIFISIAINSPKTNLRKKLQV